MKETHLWSLKDGKKGRRDFAREELRRKKPECNCSGGMGRERAEKFQGKGLEGRG